jgi:hypothetical protein
MMKRHWAEADIKNNIEKVVNIYFCVTDKDNNNTNATVKGGWWTPSVGVRAEARN